MTRGSLQSRGRNRTIVALLEDALDMAVHGRGQGWNVQQSKVEFCKWLDGARKRPGVRLYL